MKRETFYRCVHADGNNSYDKKLFESRHSAWDYIFHFAYDMQAKKSNTFNAVCKRLKRQGWRVQKVAVVDAADYENLSCNHKSLKRSAVFWRDYAEKHCEKFELEIEILEDQIEQLKKENKILRDLDADRMAGWDAYMRLEKQMYRPKLAYMGLGAALASAGIIGADLLLKAFG